MEGAEAEAMPAASACANWRTRPMTTPSPRPLTRQRVEHALGLLAGIIVGSNDEDAAALAPVYARLERELAEMGDSDDIRIRARMRLAEFMPGSTPKQALKKLRLSGFLC